MNQANKETRYGVTQSFVSKNVEYATAVQYRIIQESGLLTRLRIDHLRYGSLAILIYIGTIKQHTVPIENGSDVHQVSIHADNFSNTVVDKPGMTGIHANIKPSCR